MIPASALAEAAAAGLGLAFAVLCLKIILVRKLILCELGFQS